MFASASLSRVWVTNVRPAVVLFYNLALLVLRLILIPTVLCRTTAPTEHHLYLMVPASGSHLVSTFSHYRRPVVVHPVSSSLALDFIVCAYYFPPFLTLLVVYIFHPTLFPSLCLYSPFDLFSFLILCYLTCIRSRNC